MLLDRRTFVFAAGADTAKKGCLHLQRSERNLRDFFVNFLSIAFAQLIRIILSSVDGRRDGEVQSVIILIEQT